MALLRIWKHGSFAYYDDIRPLNSIEMAWRNWFGEHIRYEHIPGSIQNIR